MVISSFRTFTQIIPKSLSRHFLLQPNKRTNITAYCITTKEITMSANPHSVVHATNYVDPENEKAHKKEGPAKNVVRTTMRHDQSCLFSTNGVILSNSNPDIGILTLCIRHETPQRK